jgi:hypothetical protein
MELFPLLKKFIAYGAFEPHRLLALRAVHECCVIASGIDAFIHLGLKYEAPQPHRARCMLVSVVSVQGLR